MLSRSTPERTDPVQHQNNHHHQPTLKYPSIVLEQVLIVGASLLGGLRLYGGKGDNAIVGVDLAAFSLVAWLVYFLPFRNRSKAEDTPTSPPGEGRRRERFDGAVRELEDCEATPVHRLWGVPAKYYRPFADDGALYGLLLLPTLAAAKLLDALKVGGHPVNLDYYRSYLELCLLLSSLTLPHLFTSKLRPPPTRSPTGILTLVEAATVFGGIGLVLLIETTNFMPTLHKLPWQYTLFGVVFYKLVLYFLAFACKRSFTLGEMVAVAQALTVLTMQAWLETADKLNWFLLPDFARNQTPDLVQTHIHALILGVLVAALVTYPVLAWSRRLAQTPTWKSKNAAGLERSKRLAAASVYLGLVAVVLVLVSPWVQTVAGVNPFAWVITFIFGRVARVMLCVYWAVCVIVSVTFMALLQRQRRNNRPMLSLNSKRKFFHAVAVFLFVPGYIFDAALLRLAFGVALAAFLYIEQLRYFAVQPYGRALHVFLADFLDPRDVGPVILSHTYLLVGCASTVWLAHPNTNNWVGALSGVLSLGFGDALASIVGKRWGRHPWPQSNKTVEGSAAFIGSVIATTAAIAWCLGIAWGSGEWLRFTVVVLLTATIEAISRQNDNLFIPLYMFSLLSLVA
ncbi:uncharacterized protein VTP21DRAFT_11643 [Calcarisporiella thermophila]|uniref:uncharacterized protein n=1 Tax=Calcarisporiella thermophila TaxID=911321 RepID=UPI003743FF19